MGSSNLIKASSSDRSKFWCGIAECLQDRTVQSVQNVCKRRFNPYNYNGRWTIKDTDYLRKYIQIYGREWVKIAQHLGRTATNVKDKAKSLKLVDSNNTDTLKSKFWNEKEICLLFKLLAKGKSSLEESTKRSYFNYM